MSRFIIKNSERIIVTMLFNAFLQKESINNENTEVIIMMKVAYDDRYEFAKSLQDQHPDLTTITRKFGRYHHHVDYSPFKQKPIYKDDIVPVPGINEYGMTYRKLNAEEEADLEKHWV